MSTLTKLPKTEEELKTLIMSHRKEVASAIFEKVLEMFEYDERVARLAVSLAETRRVLDKCKADVAKLQTNKIRTQQLLDVALSLEIAGGESKLVAEARKAREEVAMGLMEVEILQKSAEDTEQDVVARLDAAQAAASNLRNAIKIGALSATSKPRNK